MADNEKPEKKKKTFAERLKAAILKESGASDIEAGFRGEQKMESAFQTFNPESERGKKAKERLEKGGRFAERVVDAIAPRRRKKKGDKEEEK